MKTYGGTIAPDMPRLAPAIPINRAAASGRAVPLNLTYGADYLLRTAAHIEPHSQARHLLISDGSPMAQHATILIKHGYIVREEQGLTGVWYKLTPKGLAYRPVPHA